MKFGQVDLGAALPPVDPAAATEADERTRDRVCREVLVHGPVTAAQLGTNLGLTPAAVRRHLDLLLEAGHVAVWEAIAGGPRRRGRPARRFVLTDAGHAAMSTGYDALAAAALRFIRDAAGTDAVKRFAADRGADLERRYAAVVEAAGTDSQARARALAGALSAEGYAASTRDLSVSDVPVGTQLCQGHCPVQDVAREFPQLCEAETEAFSRLLGVHVQRLATLAHGEHVCTTHVPMANVSTANVPTSNVKSSHDLAAQPAGGATTTAPAEERTTR